MANPRSDALVFFGATGDLAFKQTFPALLALSVKGRLDMPVVCIGRKDIGVEKMRSRAKESLEAAGPLDPKAFAKFSAQLRYVAVDYDQPETFEKIRTEVGDAKHPLSYVALPPEVFEKVASNLARAGLAKGARLVLEKPFGHDLDSAKKLSEALHPHFSEEAIFRIDHFLGKEPVENIVYFRAANSIIESSLNHDEVESIQITMAETFGVKGRAEFYDEVGAIRDVVQNHLFELVACLTMDLPRQAGHSGLREQRSKLLASLLPVSSGDIVRGQVKGYKDEKGVKPDSTTETFAVVRVGIDSERWKGVPIFIRAGKSLPVTATEALIRFKGSTQTVLDDVASPAQNHLRFRVGPTAVIAIGAKVKKNGQAMVGELTELLVHRADSEAMKPYERLLGDAIDGDPTLYADKQATEESWRVIAAALGDATPVHVYDEATWGPAEAATLTPPGGWSNPG